MTTCATAPLNPLAACSAGFTSASISTLAVNRELFTPAWTVVNLDDIWSVIMRGSDFAAMGSDGVTARARSIGRLDVSLQMWFSGWASRTGGNPVNGNPEHQLSANRRDFVGNVVYPSSEADSTRDLFVVESDGTTSKTKVHVEAFEWRAAGSKGLARAVLDLSIPAGAMPIEVPPADPNDYYGGGYE